MEPPALATRRQIRRFEPFQLGKMLAVLYGAMGLLFLPFFLIFSLVASQLPNPRPPGLWMFGLGFTVMMPVMYAVMGFVSGVVGAWIYNVVAKWIGGIVVEVE